MTPDQNSVAPSPTATRPDIPARVIAVFVALQALDVITTLLGIRMGAQESNIVVARLMHLGPTAGLLAAKCLGCLLVIAVFVGGKVRLIRLLNLWFAGLVTWNLVMIWIQRLAIHHR